MVAALALATSASAFSSPSTTRPNIVVLLTDDQDLRLGSMLAMPFARQNLVETGANLTNFFVHTPICCPSRTTLLSGRYVHNNRVSGPKEPGCMRMNTSRVDNPAWWQASLVKALYDSGYTTGLFGKVLNNMGSYGCTPSLGPEGSSLAPGVDQQAIMCKIGYYDSEWSLGNASEGQQTTLHASGSAPEEYTTSMVGNYTLDFVKRVVESGTGHKPFFAWVGPHAPHLPSTPAPWYMDHPIGELMPPHEPYYGAAGVGKHSFVGTEPVINAADEAAIDAEYSKRMRSLLSVDDIVRALLSYLSGVGEWESTYFVHTSDHGYNLGQFRVDSHKTMVYDHCTRIPFTIRGPGIGAGTKLPILASMVDVAPTLLELAATGLTTDSPAARALVAVREAMDGVSFAPWLPGPGDGRAPSNGDGRGDAETGPAAPAFKDAALIEYQSIRTTITATDPQCDAACQLDAYGRVEVDADAEAPMPTTSSPAVGPNFHPHDGPNNTFVALRVINATAGRDLLYAEFADVTDPHAWHFPPDAINFRELYDLSTGDWMMQRNVVATADKALVAELHSRLHEAIQCRGREQCQGVLK